MEINKKVSIQVVNGLIHIIGENIPKDDRPLDNDLPLIMYGVMEGAFNALAHVKHICNPKLSDIEIMEGTKELINTYLDGVEPAKEKEEGA